MGDRGRLTAEQFGWTMPADAPLYAPLPHYLPDADMLQITYECSAEGALALLPSDLELSDPPTAVLTIFRFPFGTLGAYNEAALDIGCLWQGSRSTTPPTTSWTTTPDSRPAGRSGACRRSRP